jgi:hypothetical protein
MWFKHYEFIVDFTALQMLLFILFNLKSLNHVLYFSMRYFQHLSIFIVTVGIITFSNNNNIRYNNKTANNDVQG